MQCSSYFQLIFPIWICYLTLNHCQAQPISLDASERSALVTIYDTCNGLNWRSYSQWPITDINSDACSWPGVRCSLRNTSDENTNVVVESRHVTSLNLDSFGLNCAFPSVSIESFRFLEHLDMQRNYLSGLLPTFSNGMYYLESIEIFWNQLVGTIPDTWNQERLPNLKRITLLQNKLGGVLPRGLVEHPRLQRLDLSNNRFGGILPEFKSQYLSYLRLSDNGFSGTISEKIIFPRRYNASLSENLYYSWIDLSNNFISGTLPSFSSHEILYYIFLSGNQITALTNNTIPKYLKMLDLSNNFIKAPLPLLNLSHRLTTVRLAGNSFTGEIGFLPSSIQSIDVSNNQLTKLPITWNNITQLTYFAANNNRINDTLTRPIQAKKTLTEFLVANNQLVGNISGWTFNDFPKLTTINFGGNYLSGVIPYFPPTDHTSWIRLTLSCNRFDHRWDWDDGRNLISFYDPSNTARFSVWYDGTNCYDGTNTTGTCRACTNYDPTYKPTTTKPPLTTVPPTLTPTPTPTPPPTTKSPTTVPPTLTPTPTPTNTPTPSATPTPTPIPATESPTVDSSTSTFPSTVQETMSSTGPSGSSGASSGGLPTSTIVSSTSSGIVIAAASVSVSTCAFVLILPGAVMALMLL